MKREVSRLCRVRFDLLEGKLSRTSRLPQLGNKPLGWLKKYKETVCHPPLANRSFGWTRERVGSLSLSSVRCWILEICSLGEQRR